MVLPVPRLPDELLPVDGETEPGAVLGVPIPAPLGVVVPFVEFTRDAPEPVSGAAVPGVAVVSSTPTPELPGVE